MIEKLSHRHRTRGRRYAPSHKRSRAWVAVATGLIIAVVSGPVWSQSEEPIEKKIDWQKEQLKKIQQDIEAHRNKSKELKREEASVAKQLGSLDKEIALSSKLVAGMAEQEKLLSVQIDNLRANIIYEDAVLAYQKRRLAKRLRDLYKRGPDYRLQALMGSSDIQQMLRRYKFFTAMAQRDAQLVSEVAVRKDNLQIEQAALTEALADIAAVRAQRSEEKARLETSKRSRMAMLSRIRTEKSKHAQAIKELEKSEENLRDLIGRLEQRRLSGQTGRTPPGDFARLKGKLIRPVEGRIARKFGKDRHPEFGTVTFNNGVDIQASAGTPIRAVAAGNVEFVDWISGYGNCIILNHGGGYYTLYAHASDIFVRGGQYVEAREVIAEVGDSGSLNGYECHFEIRKSKQALNPMEWFAR